MVEQVEIATPFALPGPTDAHKSENRRRGLPCKDSNLEQRNQNTSRFPRRSHDALPPITSEPRDWSALPGIKLGWVGERKESQKASVGNRFSVGDCSPIRKSRVCHH